MLREMMNFEKSGLTGLAGQKVAREKDEREETGRDRCAVFGRRPVKNGRGRIAGSSCERTRWITLVHSGFDAFKPTLRQTV